MSVPIDDTLSRILEQVPEYQPARRRSEKRRARPLLNPGIFTVQRIAAALETTVGDLLGEASDARAAQLVTDEADEKMLRTVLAILTPRLDALKKGCPSPSFHPNRGDGAERS
jgi:hypothetical protein